MKRKHIGIAMLVCVTAILLPVLIVQAPSPWTTQDMVDYMYNVGRHKIWMTNYIVRNEIKPAVYEIRDLMGQGLVGEYWDWNDIGSHNLPAGETTMFEYDPPHPKKFSLWIETDLMVAGESVTVRVYYDGDNSGLLELYQSRTYSTLDRSYLVVDQLAIFAEIRVTFEPNVPDVVAVHGSVIIEEV